MHKTNEQQQGQGRADIGFEASGSAQGGGQRTYPEGAGGVAGEGEYGLGQSAEPGSSHGVTGGAAGSNESAAAPITSPQQHAFGGAQEEGGASQTFAYPAPVQSENSHY